MMRFRNATDVIVKLVTLKKVGSGATRIFTQDPELHKNYVAQHHCLCGLVSFGDWSFGEWSVYRKFTGVKTKKYSVSIEKKN
jgi:hypothetical protein